MKERKLEKLKVICRYCNGTGKREITRFKKSFFHTDKERKKAFDLFKRGLSLRAIGKKIGIKHPQTVHWLIKVYLKNFKNANRL
jgi:hypothetical protein